MVSDALLASVRASDNATVILDSLNLFSSLGRASHRDRELMSVPF
jgi:hypothetical protein